MPIDIPKALIEAGGWTVAAAVAIGVITLLIRGDLVTGRSAKDALDRETKRADKATEQLERTSSIGERLIVETDRTNAQLTLLVDLLAKMFSRTG